MKKREQSCPEENTNTYTQRSFPLEGHAPNDFYQQLFEHAVEAILVCSLDGVVIQANRRAELLLGRPRQVLLACHYLEFFSPVTGPLLAQQLVPCLLSSASVSFEAEIVRNDETRVPVEVRATLVEDPCESPQRMQIFVRDIAQKKIVDCQRADFLEMLAHDIRSPLSVVIGYADLLLSAAQIRASHEEIDMLLSLRSGAFSLSTLVMNYLDVAKIEARPLLLAKHPVAINEVLCRVGRQYEREAQRLLVSLHFDLCDDLPFVVGDRLAIERVITNLLHNALKFTPAKGKITLRSMRRPDGNIAVSIADTGSGMTAEEVAVVFEKYRTTKKNRKKEGSGLGLFIVKTLVEGHGGRVEVESVPGGGTCISVLLPILANCETYVGKIF